MKNSKKGKGEPQKSPQREVMENLSDRKGKSSLPPDTSKNRSTEVDAAERRITSRHHTTKDARNQHKRLDTSGQDLD